jgi:uncharacterized membrane protein YciS (DUF1049 family)
MTGKAIISSRFAVPFDARFAAGGVTAVFVFIVSRLKLSKIRRRAKTQIRLKYPFCFF